MEGHWPSDGFAVVRAGGSAARLPRAQSVGLHAFPDRPWCGVRHQPLRLAGGFGVLSLGLCVFVELLGDDLGSYVVLHVGVD